MTRLALIAVLLAGTKPAGLKEHVERLVAQVRVSAADFDLKTHKGQEAFKSADVRAAEASGELLATLQKNPEAWVWARPELRRMPAAADRRDLKLRLIELLAHDADSASVKILDAELKADARGIPVRAIIRMVAPFTPFCVISSTAARMIFLRFSRFCSSLIFIKGLLIKYR